MGEAESSESFSEFKVQMFLNIDFSLITVLVFFYVDGDILWSE